MARTRDVNLTRRSDVKAVYADLRQSHGEQVSPRTAVTRTMMRHLLETVIPERGGSEIVNVRTLLMCACEIMFGIRVVEVLSGGDFHGVLANNLVLLQKLNEHNNEPEGEVTAEMMLEHSKTKEPTLHQRRGPFQRAGEGRAREICASLLEARGFSD